MSVTPVVHKLGVRQNAFVVNGAVFKLKSVSMFTLAQRFEDGEDIEPQIRWCLARGAHAVEVVAQFAFMYWPQVVRFIAKEDTILALTRLLAARGLYVNWRVLLDCQATSDDGQHPALNMSHAKQVERVRRVHALLKDESGCGILSIANEPPFNGVDVWRIVDDLGWATKSARGGQLISSGDYGTHHLPAARALDVIGDHPQRDDTYPNEAAKRGFQWWEGWPPDAHSPGFIGYKHFPENDIALWTEEPQKYGESANDGGDTADPSIDNAEQAGGGWSVGMSGACFHSVDGIRSRVPGPNQTACADAFFAAMDFSPVDAFSAGRYSHDGFADWPLEPTTQAGEVAGRIMPDGTVYAVCSQPEASWQPVVKPGRVMEERKGRGGTLMRIR